MPRRKRPTDKQIVKLALAWHRAWREYSKADMAYDIDGPDSGHSLDELKALGEAGDEAERALRDALDEYEEGGGQG